MTGMTWNIRVMNCPSDNLGDDFFAFKEVHYEDGRPVAYGEPFLSSETKEGLAEIISRLEAAMNHPVLHENEFSDEA